MNIKVGDRILVHQLLVADLENGNELEISGEYYVDEISPFEPSAYVWQDTVTLSPLDGTEDGPFYDVGQDELWRNIDPVGHQEFDDLMRAMSEEEEKFSA